MSDANLIAAVFFFAVFMFVLYVVIRNAVRGGIEDALDARRRRHRRPPGPGPDGSPPAGEPPDGAPR